MKLGTAAAITGPAVGFGATLWAMACAFQALGTSGSRDPSTVSTPVGEVLIPLMAGLLIGAAGLAVAITAWMRLKRHPIKPHDSAPN